MTPNEFTDNLDAQQRALEALQEFILPLASKSRRARKVFDAINTLRGTLFEWQIQIAEIHQGSRPDDEPADVIAPGDALPEIETDLALYAKVKAGRS